VPEESSSTWRNSLKIVADSISAERFHEELDWLRKEYGDEPGDIAMIYAGLLAEWFVESAALFAAIELPPEEVPPALAEIHETLAGFDFDRERTRAEENERQYYDAFATWAAQLFTELGKVMESLFNCYVTAGYDPEDNPNDLIAEALKISDEDLTQAQDLITQAGAIGLHSHPLWWRWQEEAYGPARTWLGTMVNLVEDYTSSGRALLGPIEQARAEMADSCRKAEEEIREMEEVPAEPEPPTSEPSPVEDLIEELIAQGETHFTPNQLALCQTHREDAIPALIELATDEYLQSEDSPGDGYAPIHAVELLGQLKAAEATPALIDVVADTDYSDFIYSAAILALENFGPPALEPLLDFLRYSWDIDSKIALAGAVAEAGRDDERAYRALLDLWAEATWEEGKALLAQALAQVGGEQVIPMFQAVLEDPDLDWMDYNQVGGALEVLGVEVPWEDAPSPPPDVVGDISDLDAVVHPLLSEISDPEQLIGFADAAPKEWRAYPDGMAHAYADIQRDRVNSMIAVQAVAMPLELSTPLTASLLREIETLTFDALPRGYPRQLRKAYTHLAECAGPALQLQLAGVLIALQHYLGKDYDIADDPNQLLSAACELSPEDEALRHLFGQAGALILHGRSFWPRWPAETDRPLSEWLEGLVEFRAPLERIGQIPLRPGSETAPDRLSNTLLDALTSLRIAEEPPPGVAELLELLITQKQDTLPSAQRRRFAHQRAAIIPHLIRMVEDTQYWHEDGPGGGWAAILAVQLLGDLKAAQAADTLVSVVADSQPQDVIHDAALFSLMAIGRPALPAVRAYFLYGRSIETKTSLAEVLGRIGRQRQDTFDLLRQVWETTDWTENRRTVALAFGDLRDRRAIPLLQTALEDPHTDALDVDYIHWSLLHLGTQPPPIPIGKSSRLKTPAPYNRRLIYDEFDTAQRLKYTAWGEPLCPDCGKLLALDRDGNWTHPPEAPSHQSASSSTKRRRKKRKKRRR